jgi:hypothetical protein
VIRRLWTRQEVRIALILAPASLAIGAIAAIIAADRGHLDLGLAPIPPITTLESVWPSTPSTFPATSPPTPRSSFPTRTVAPGPTTTRTATPTTTRRPSTTQTTGRTVTSTAGPTRTHHHDPA